MKFPLAPTHEVSSMNALASDTIHKPVDEVFGQLDFTDEPSSFEVNGRRVIFVVRPTAEPVTPDVNWSEVQGKRRHQLIDLKISGVITAVELLELAQLNEQFERYASRVAPLPMSHALELLAKITGQANDKHSKP
jgi:hypothetical protein